MSRYANVPIMHALWTYATPDGVRTIWVPAVRFATGSLVPDLLDDLGAEWAQGTAD